LPLIGIKEISALWDRDALATVPLFIISIAEEKVIVVIVNMHEIGRGHGFESLRRYTGEARSFGVLELLYCLAKFIPGDWIIEFPKSSTLGYLVKDGLVGVPVIAVDLGRD
jgi:hypothetical protein